jgi:hypothetical protein
LIDGRAGPIIVIGIAYTVMPAMHTINIMEAFPFEKASNGECSPIERYTES